MKKFILRKLDKIGRKYGFEFAIIYTGIDNGIAYFINEESFEQKLGLYFEFQNDCFILQLYPKNVTVTKPTKPINPECIKTEQILYKDLYKKMPNIISFIENNLI